MRLLVAMLAVLALRGLLPGSRPSTIGHSAVASVVETTTFEASHALSGDAAGRFLVLLLEQAERTLAGVHDMRAMFRKRERIDGQLQDLNTMDLKVRRAPLSVYMRWHEPYAGREIIWQENTRDGQILVHAGGWQRKLLPILKIDPLGERAMEFNRRPVTQIGLWNFNQRLLSNLRTDLALVDVRVWMTQDQRIDDRPCYCFGVLHTQKTDDARYRRLHVYVDQLLALPVACEVYGWGTADQPDEAPLEESYAFASLALNVGMTDLDFDEKNPAYNYGVR